MAAFAPLFREVLESELPEWLPRPDDPPDPVGERREIPDVVWWRGERPLDEPDDIERRAGTLEIYVRRCGNGGAPPFYVSVLTGWRAKGVAKRLPTRACWPRFEDVWAALTETCLEGALFQLPAHIAGDKYSAKLEGQAVTIVRAVQVGAIAGSPAFFRFSLANKGAGVLQ